MIKLSRGVDDLSVCASVCPVHCRETADRIRMPFGIIGQTGSGMRHVVGFRDRSTGKGTFGGEIGARHCNQRGLYSAVGDFRSNAALSQITLGGLVNRPITFLTLTGTHSFIYSYSFNSLYDTPQQTMKQATLLISLPKVIWQEGRVAAL